TVLLIFDVSKYIKDHPGGAELLVEVAGTDATKAFDNAGYSEDAAEIMREFCVGPLKSYKKQAPKRSVPASRIVNQMLDEIGFRVPGAMARMEDDVFAFLIWDGN
ncbi:Cytochrome b5, partial [Madurella mycetomatis]